ncbi:MAG: hypothetical protein CMI85_06095 [Candidatus Pelagibacter sp.]|nr:hypothetical protein [Candidatus Pelagibacter sp.]|tara:strand:- start:811 stop:1002 length:192 start_codon:yes stop_codon:yes gene_type:complete
MIDLKKNLDLLKKYKKEIIFTIAIAIMCFSIALWALAMNHIKYQNILGTFKIINSHSQNAYYK